MKIPVHKKPIPKKWTQNNIVASMARNEQVHALLKRLRYTLPCPVDLFEIYLHCMPEAIHTYHKRGLFLRPTSLPPGTASNLLRSMHFSTDNFSAVHISMDPEQDYLRECRAGNLGHRAVFWVDLPQRVPCPINSMMTPLFMPTEYPYRHALLDWHKEAHALEEDIQSTTKIITQYTRIAHTVRAVKCTWPELLSFVDLPDKSAPRETLAMRRGYISRVAEVLSSTDKIRIINQLSTATMIPETAVKPPAAWVGYYTSEHYR